MPLIAYQSFNSNASTTHGLDSLSMQPFTRQTNSYVTDQQHKALVLPHNSGDLATPIEGPAHLVPIKRFGEQNGQKRKREGDDSSDEPAAKAAKTGEHTAPVFGAQISLLWQNFYRQFGEMPAIMVCGELDSSNADFSGLIGGANVSDRAIPAAKACQSFTAITRNGMAAAFVTEGDGYVVYSIANLNVVFVHVPNKIAKTGSDTAAFYKNIAQGLLSNGKMIHLVIGDTNQGNADFTMQALNTAFQTKSYANALAGGTITKIDNYGVTERGTNAKGTQLYDVAVYRSDVVQLKGNVAYLSQSSNAVTVTDHCGLGVVVELKSK